MSKLGLDNPAMYMEEDEVDTRPESRVAVPDEPAKDTEGAMERFKKGVRSLWATRQTEDTGDDMQLHVRTTLRELFIYVCFLIVLLVVTFGMTSTTSFYYTKVMSDLFLQSSFSSSKITFRQMTTVGDFWDFANGPLLDGLYWEKWYNNRNVSEDELGYIFYENKLLGVPRLRQLKVRNDSCIVKSDFQNDIKQCFDMYAEGIEDKAPFGKMNGSAWEWESNDVLEAGSHTGIISSYEGNGFVADLSTTQAASAAIVDELKTNLWITRGTRAVFMDFTVYNANINLFCVVRLLVEFPATGGIIPSFKFSTVRLIRYVDVSDYFVLACEVVFIFFIFYYLVEEVLEIKKHRLQYFKSSWNILDMIVIIVSVLVIIFSVYRFVVVDNKLTDLLEKPHEYVDFQRLAYYQVEVNNIQAFLVFFAWIKVFKYISFNKTMTQLSRTLSSCFKDLVGFFFMFFIIFFAFAQLGYLIFGNQVKDFRSFGQAVFTLIRIILGDFDFHALQEADRMFGPIYFLVYVFFVFFVLLNMFLAIINDTYSEVKSDLANQKSEFEIGPFLKKGYMKVMEKMNYKRDKIMDLQSALKNADQNADDVLDFEEWRADLKMRGYADHEIEAVFSKYDVDGDRVLSKDEQMAMNDDMEREKRELDEEEGGVQLAAAAMGNMSGGGGSGASQREFMELSQRVDQMEESIGSIVEKIDVVLIKLETMETAKGQRRDSMNKILNSITEGNADDRTKRMQMERLVKEELHRWDSEDSASPPSSADSRARQRARSAKKH